MAAHDAAGSGRRHPAPRADNPHRHTGRHHVCRRPRRTSPRYASTPVCRGGKGRTKPFQDTSHSMPGRAGAQACGGYAGPHVPCPATPAVARPDYAQRRPGPRAAGSGRVSGMARRPPPVACGRPARIHCAGSPGSGGRGPRPGRTIRCRYEGPRWSRPDPRDGQVCVTAHTAAAPRTPGGGRTLGPERRGRRHTVWASRCGCPGRRRASPQIPQECQRAPSPRGAPTRLTHAAPLATIMVSPRKIWLPGVLRPPV